MAVDTPTSKPGNGIRIVVSYAQRNGDSSIQGKVNAAVLHALAESGLAEKTQMTTNAIGVKTILCRNFEDAQRVAASLVEHALPDFIRDQITAGKQIEDHRKTESSGGYFYYSGKENPFEQKPAPRTAPVPMRHQLAIGKHEATVGRLAREVPATTLPFRPHDIRV